MSTTDQVLSEFIDAWNAGERPRVAAYLDRVPEGDRDALADAISVWLATAPAPSLSAEARAAVRAEPVVARVLSDEGAWPSVLPQLRAQAGFSVRDLAARLVERFSVGDAGRAETYLERMERGSLGPDQVSRRLLDALGGLLGVSGTSLGEMGGMRPSVSAGTLFRADEDRGEWVASDIDALSRAATTPAPPPMDELDRLFLGGPDA
jgi:transcriptional regulator with XRE-family HTH domain